MSTAPVELAQLRTQATRDDIPTYWVPKAEAHELIRSIKPVYRMLYDLTVIDERVRSHREDQPPSDFTVVYILSSFERNEYLSSR